MSGIKCQLSLDKLKRYNVFSIKSGPRGPANLPTQARWTTRKGMRLTQQPSGPCLYRLPDPDLVPAPMLTGAASLAAGGAAQESLRSAGHVRPQAADPGFVRYPFRAPEWHSRSQAGQPTNVAGDPGGHRDGQKRDHHRREDAGQERSVIGPLCRGQSDALGDIAHKVRFDSFLGRNTYRR